MSRRRASRDHPPIPSILDAEIDVVESFITDAPGGYHPSTNGGGSSLSRGGTNYASNRNQQPLPHPYHQQQQHHGNHRRIAVSNHMQQQQQQQDARSVYSAPNQRGRGSKEFDIRAPSMRSLAKSQSAYLFEEQRNDLQELLDFPKGLAEELGKTRSLFPSRFWILDNSGSMLSNDGALSKKGMRVRCTRWKELEETVAYHAELAALLQATTFFRLLNDPGVRVGPQEFSVAADGKSIDEEIKNVKKILRHTQPNGATPLTLHVKEITDRIREMEGAMRQRGLQAVVVIATDGLPTSLDGQTSNEINNEFINALSRLQTLPVWIVIRLCTDERAVVDFYNALDSVLELPLEVLDDHLHEAREIYRVNPWLNYALPLHRCREIGYQHRIFDLLDERPLNKDEVVEFCKALLGDDHFTICPDIHTNFSGFLKFLSGVLKHEKPQLNPLTQKITPWIDVTQLKRSFRRGLFAIFKRKPATKG